MKVPKVSGLLLLVLCTIGLCACGVSDGKQNNAIQNNTTIQNNTKQRELLQVTDEKRYTEFIVDDVELESDIIYAEAECYDGQMQELGLDIYSPKGDKETARPAIIWVHGGSYIEGDKASEGFLKYLATDFAKMGYVSVVINYRLGKEASLATIDRAIEDSKSALEWVSNNAKAYGIDENNIALVGYSAGGGIVKNLCYTNLYEEMDRTMICGVVSISGDDLYHSMTSETAPACLAIHGTADSTVNYTISEKFINKLSEHGITSELYPLEGLNHNLLTRYGEIRNQIGEFLYEQLTGQEREITIASEVSIEYKSVLTRRDNGIEYQVKPIECQVDGKLDEWGTFETIPMNQLKDAGDIVPQEEDYKGKAMVGWNPKEPNCIYIAAEVIDDVYQDSIAADGKWYHDDCLEIIFDLSMDDVAEQFLKYVVGAGGEMSVLANKESTQSVVIREGNTYRYEVAIDLSILPEGTLQRSGAEQLSIDQCIGFSIAYNDSDNGTREAQIGWTSGASSDRTSFGNLVMVE